MQQLALWLVQPTGAIWSCVILFLMTMGGVWLLYGPTRAKRRRRWLKASIFAGPRVFYVSMTATQETLRAAEETRQGVLRTLNQLPIGRDNIFDLSEDEWRRYGAGERTTPKNALIICVEADEDNLTICSSNGPLRYAEVPVRHPDYVSEEVIELLVATQSELHAIAFAEVRELAPTPLTVLQMESESVSA